MRCAGLRPADPERAYDLSVWHERGEAQRPLESLQGCPFLNEHLRRSLFRRGAVHGKHKRAFGILESFLLRFDCVSAAKAHGP